MNKSDDLEKATEANADFSTPMRQSYTAILLIAYRLYKVIIRQLFPLIIVLFFGGSFGENGYFMVSVIVIGVLGFIYSIFAFLKYYFWLQDDKLVIQKGVFKKTKTEIPFDRIQTINFEQNLIHRLFNVVKLNMDTAGSAGAELQINALDQTLAKNISDHILSRKTELPTTGAEVESANDRRHKKTIFRLPIPQLLKVGITENHLKSGGFIILFFIWIWENLRDAGLDVEEKIEDYVPDAEAISTSLMLVSFFVILFIVVSFLISLIRTVLKYYGLQMYRSGDGFIIESGLFNRREIAAKDQKIQILSWAQNLLQKWTSIYELRMRQASSVANSAQSSITVAGLEWQDVSDTETYLFKERYTEVENIDFQPVDPYYRYRRMVFWTVLALPLFLIAYAVDSPRLMIITGVSYLLGLVGSHLSYKKKRWGISESMVMLRGGVFGNNAMMMELFKVQNVMVYSTPFQRRRALSSIILQSASGQVIIPDIGQDIVASIQDYILFKVESSNESWM